jgi:hypothetical protein
VWFKSSLIPTVKCSFGFVSARLSYTAFTIAGVTLSRKDRTARRMGAILTDLSVPQTFL